jgi:hypothetical protein
MAIDFPNSPSVNDVYSADERSWTWDGTAWRLLNGWQTATLDDLYNVTVPAPSSGEFLKWNGSAWVNDSIPTINTLDDVGDVTITSAASGEFLKWNGSAWVNDSIPTINELDDVGDVTITSASAGQFLKWNGTAWVNDSIPTVNELNDIGNVDIDIELGEGDVLAYDANSDSWKNYSLGPYATDNDVRDTLIKFYMEVI